MASATLSERTTGGDVTVFKGGLLHEVTLVAEALEAEGIPYYQRIDSFTGVEEASVLPVPGPGTFFVIKVPEAAAEDAAEVIHGLGVSQEAPQLWTFHPTSRARHLWRGMAAAYLVVVLGSMVFMTVRHLLDLL